MKKWLIYLFLCLSGLVFSQKPIQIVLSPDASEPETRAASVLQHYLKGIAGAPIPILKTQKTKGLGRPVFIGNHPALSKFHLQTLAPLNPDAYALEGRSNAWHIAGGGDMGAEYGVYSFLEILGCRKYTPSDSFIPYCPNLDLPVCPFKVETPAFAYRELHYEPVYDPNWARWHKLKSKPQKEAEWGMFVHTFDKLCPAETWFETHPEYFSWNGRQYTNGQICLSNDTVLQIVVANLSVLMRERPNALYWSVSQNDNFDYCKCPRCAASDARYGSAAGTLLAFVNKVAAAFPDKTISTLAYQYTRRAPKGIVPAANVSVCLCSIECNRGQAIAEGCPDFARDVEEWSAICHNLMIWDYVVQFRSYISPFPNWESLQPNLQLFQNNGVKMLFEQGSGSSRSEFSDMRAYLLAKLMWTPQANMDSILNDFGEGYYGADKGLIWAYIHQSTEALHQNGRHLWIYDVPPNEAFLRSLPLREWSGRLGSSHSDPHMREAQLPLLFAILEIAKTDSAVLAQEDGRLMPWEPLLNWFVEGCNISGIKTLHERNYPPEQYALDYHAFMKNQALAAENKAFSPVMAVPASVKYAGGNAALLCDHKVGETDYRYNWIGFEGADLDAIVQVKGDSLRSVSVAFLQDQASWVFLPLEVCVEISEDGLHFQKLECRRLTEGPEGEKKRVVLDFELPVQQPATQVRVRADNRGVCPPWHNGNGLPCWIFVDEVLVR